MNCVWRHTGNGFYTCKNCKIPASKTKRWATLPPARNCQNPSAQFLLGDFLARCFERFSPEFKLRWGQRIDRLMGLNPGAKSCHCALRQKALNDWTLRLVSVPIYQRPWLILIDSVHLAAAILRWAPSRVNKA